MGISRGGGTVVVVDLVDPDELVVRRAVDVLASGGVVAYPTETFYGLGVDAANVLACAALFEIKGRPKDKALPCVIGSPEDLDAVARTVPPAAARLCRRFWPGPLTLVVDARPGLAAASYDGSVAVRVSGLELARRLCRAFGGPITSTSANPSGARPPRSAHEVLEALDGDVDLILDGGTSPGGAPSTIVDVRADRPVLLREGAIPFSLVMEALSSSKS